MTEADDVIAAVATANGPAAIGIVRLSGPNLSRFMQPLCGRTLTPRHAVFTDFLDFDGKPLDSGIALFFPTPHSYTGDDVLELQGHGGPAVLQSLLRRCLSIGARLAQPGEFTRRAFLNGKLDLAQAEGVADLIEASSEAAARAALRSLKGEFSKEVLALVSEVIAMRVEVEARIDFPEETDVGDDRVIRTSLQNLREKLERTRLRAASGSRLRDTLQVVLVGSPNVGKSSLLNRLSGDDAAIVSAIPGTTRDIIRKEILLDGFAVQLVDTAGLRETHDVLERMGIDRTVGALREADVVLLINDVPSAADRSESWGLADLPNETKRIRVLNKIDLVGREPAKRYSSGIIEVQVSAKTGAGIGLLRSALLEVAGLGPQVEGVFLARERHLESLMRAQSHLANGAQHLEHVELLAENLRLAQLELAAITGEFTADDLLGQIFSKFCLGK